MRKKNIRLDKLKSILSQFPQVAKDDIEVWAEVNQLLDELEKLDFINFMRKPGFGDPIYNQTSETPTDPNQEQIEKYGIEFLVEPCRSTTKYQWKLIRETVAKVGFRHCGGGQRNWFLFLRRDN